MFINDHIRSFSSYSKGLYVVSGIFSHTAQDEFIELKLLFPLWFQAKLEKRIQKFKCSALSIDGVYAQISFDKQIIKSAEYFEVIAKIAKEVFFQTPLSALQCDDKVSIGMISTNPKKWLLDSLPTGKVRLEHIKIAEGHKYTKELTFECSKELFDRIEKAGYIGLNASGFFIKKLNSLDGRHYFSIHVGKETREKTVFGKENLALGSEFNLTLPFVSQTKNNDDRYP